MSLSSDSQPRNLVNTNVIKLYECLRKDESQRTYYSSGVGTSAKPWSPSLFLERCSDIVDLIIAWKLEKVITNAYRWLADNYQDNDRIFFFGYSRGAYQVRVLAAMIECVGLIHAGNLQQIPFAWELYSKPNPDKQEYQAKVGQFKRMFSRSVRVYFLGAWDTVSSVGVIRGELLPLTTSNQHIVHFRHALALDERRVKFLPEYAMDGSSIANTAKEVWFIGSHSDVGGKKHPNKSDSGSEPLIWMMEEAKWVGLKLCRQNVQARIPPATWRADLSPRVWWVLEGFPILRSSPKHDNNLNQTRKPHLGKGRRIMLKNNQKLHWTVFAAGEFNDNYQPQALFKGADGQTSALRDINNLDPSRRAEDYCDGGYDCIEVLKLLHKIDPDLNPQKSGGKLEGRLANLWQTIQQPWQQFRLGADASIIHDKEELYQEDTVQNQLEELRKFACSGYANIIWIYGGPRFLHKLLVISSGNINIEKLSEDIIKNVVDPRCQVRWQENLNFITGSNMISESIGADDMDEVVLPRLHDLLQLCCSSLEPPKQSSGSKRKTRAQLIPLSQPKSGRDTHNTNTTHIANKLASIVLEITSELLSGTFFFEIPCIRCIDSKLYIECNGEMDRESTFIKDIPKLLFSPPVPDMLQTVPVVGLGTLNFSHQMLQKSQLARKVTQLIVDITKHGSCWEKLCHGEVITMLLPWIRVWNPVKPSVTAEMIRAIRILASEPKVANTLVREEFVVFMAKCFIECTDSDCREKRQEALNMLVLLTSYRHDEPILSQVMDTKMIYELVALMKTGQSADGIHILANLAEYRTIRNQILDYLDESRVPVVISSLTRYFKSCSTSAPDSPISPISPLSERFREASEGRHLTHTINTILTDVVKNSLKLIVELTKHNESRAKLSKYKENLLNELTKLLVEEREARTAPTPGPIAEEVFKALPMFVLHPELEYPILFETLVSLAGSYGSKHTGSSWKIYTGLEAMLRRHKGDGESYELTKYRESAADLVPTLAEQAVDTSNSPPVAKMAAVMIVQIAQMKIGIFSWHMIEFSIKVMDHALEQTIKQDNKSFPPMTSIATAHVTIQVFELIRALLNFPKNNSFHGRQVMQSDWERITRLVEKLSDKLKPRLCDVDSAARDLLEILEANDLTSSESLSSRSTSASVQNGQARDGDLGGDERRFLYGQCPEVGSLAAAA
ncbi:unnamed protein product [Rhizoctonia solani]|uniref:T6SS Phospholipase effector Tle1-like catalytic domain-containing protein n=1 Tax=Rhizoctonia solani TaxID=456999 RepID=A0A8H3GTK3_9AGAM|nr:unnamed protein product [Rhizoctonia solani]